MKLLTIVLIVTLCGCQQSDAKKVEVYKMCKDAGMKAVASQWDGTITCTVP